MADLFSKGLTAINVKTSTFLEEKKIQTYVAKLESEIETLEKEIGKKIYSVWADEQEITVELIAELLEEIKKKNETIAEQKEAAIELSRKEAEILGKSEGPKPSKIFWSKCGQAYDTPVNFCRSCGTKMEV